MVCWQARPFPPVSLPVLNAFKGCRPVFLSAGTWQPMSPSWTPVLSLKTARQLATRAVLRAPRAVGGRAVSRGELGFTCLLQDPHLGSMKYMWQQEFLRQEDEVKF